MSMSQFFSYDFTTIENPLSNGGNFTTISDADFNGVLQVISGNLCEPVTTGTACASFYSGTVLAPGGTCPNDQYSELTIATLPDTLDNTAYWFVRQGAANSGTQYLANLSGTGSNFTSTLFAVVAGTVHTLASHTGLSTSMGDVWRLSIAGNVLTFSKNGTAQYTFTDSNNYISSGSPGFGLNSASGLTDAQASLWAAGANQCVTPTFNPGGGTYGPSQNVAITSSTAGATIFYTLDGSTPNESSASVANGATVLVSTSLTLNAIASKTDFFDSAAESATYDITGAPTAATPTFSPSAGTYDGAQTITISSTTPGGTIYYTTSGGTPNHNSPSIANGGTVRITASGTIQAIESAPDFTDSGIGTAAYIIFAATPTVNAQFQFAPVNGNNDILQFKNNIGTVVSWIDHTGTGQGNLQNGSGGGGNVGVGLLPLFTGYIFSINNLGVISAQNGLTGTVDFTGTDATVVFNSAIGNLPNGGRLICTDGVYTFNTLILETTSGFSNYYALGIPGGGPNFYASWSIEGDTFTPPIDLFSGNTIQTNGVVFYITPTAIATVSTSTAVMGIWSRPDATNGVGPIVSFKNLTVRFPDNQRGSTTGIDSTQALMADYQYITTDFNIAWNNVVFPVAGSAGQYGVTSTNSAHEQNYFKNVYPFGSNVGFDIQSEHTVMHNAFAVNCNIAIQYGVRGVGIVHGSSWQSVGWGECKRGLLLGSQCHTGSLLEISTLDMEDATASIFPTFQPVYHALETNSGNSFGRISYSRSTAGGPNSTLTNLFDGGGGGNFTLVHY